MSDATLSILYQDERYVAIDKPAGLLVHRSPIDPKETQFAVQLLHQQIQRRVFPVHRLDRPTSGTLLFALDPEAHRAMSMAFQQRQVAKTYHALVRGHPPAGGQIERPLRPFLDNEANVKGAIPQEASTAFECQKKAEFPYQTNKYDSMRLSLLRLRPQTGRRHQLRRHLAGLGYPIVGDSRYGDTRFNLIARQRLFIEGLMLTASELAFEHPFTGDRVLIQAPLDCRWSRIQQLMDAYRSPSASLL